MGHHWFAPYVRLELGGAKSRFGYLREELDESEIISLNTGITLGVNAVILNSFALGPFYQRVKARDGVLWKGIGLQLALYL